MSFMEFRNYSDGELYKLIAADNETALKVLFQRYYKPLCEFVRIYTKVDVVCEEIVADLFVKVWNRRKAGTINDLKNYLFISARNLAFNFREKKVEPISFMENLNDFESSFYNDQNPLSIISDKESCRSILSLIDLLPERQREVLLMSRIDHLDKVRIAEILSISVRTVETTLYAAISQLRSILSRHNKAF